MWGDRACDPHNHLTKIFNQGERMNQFTQALTGTTGMIIIAIVAITGILYFFMPWFVAAISNKITKIVDELKTIAQLLREIKAELKKKNNQEQEK